MRLVPLGTRVPIALVGQATTGAIRYAVDNPLFTGQTPNLAFSGGAGLVSRLRGRFSPALVKDYIASFRSVDDLASLGVHGRRAHTIAILVGLGVGL